MATNTTAVQAKVAKPIAAPGPWREAFGRLIRNKLAVVGLILVILLLFCGIFGPFIAPWPYQVQDLAAVFRRTATGRCHRCRRTTSSAPTSSGVTC